MKNLLKDFVWAIGLGIMLVAYAHTTFATKDVASDIHEDIREIRSDVKEILKGMK
jgi:Na+/serine symporter